MLRRTTRTGSLSRIQLIDSVQILLKVGYQCVHPANDKTNSTAYLEYFQSIGKFSLIGVHLGKVVFEVDKFLHDSAINATSAYETV